jgi:hypothetical protein
MKVRAGALALVVLLVAGCGVRVAVESDESARHGQWKTWSWLSRPPVAAGDTAYALADERVRTAFDREMKTRGFRRVERERPDFLVTYYAAIERPIEAKAVAYAAGGPSRTAANAQGLYEQGMLLVDVLDSRSGKLVWRGAGRKVFTPEQSPEERRERIDQAVASVVGEFANR